MQASFLWERVRCLMVAKQSPLTFAKIVGGLTIAEDQAIDTMRLSLTETRVERRTLAHCGKRTIVEETRVRTRNVSASMVFGRICDNSGIAYGQRKRQA